MRRGWIGSAILVIAFGILVLRPWEGGGDAAQAPGPAPIAGARVARVIDGDTIEVEIDGRREDVRLIGVDTPETVKPGTPVQCFGPRASSFAHRALDGRRVRIEPGVEQRDVYGRLLAYVSLGRRSVNAMLLRRGLARNLTIPPNVMHAPIFRRLELRAARAGRGLWGACPP
jgi:micrococcal nuclease